MKKKNNFYWVAGIIFLLILSGCGGSDSNAPVSSLTIDMSEFVFNPSSMTVFTNKEITLKLTNSGSVLHDFTILKKGAVAAIPFNREEQSGDILVEFKVGANQNDTFKFTLPEEGEYTIICAVQGHMESGMVAKIKAVNQ